jgi:hypothetical protein
MTIGGISEGLDTSFHIESGYFRIDQSFSGGIECRLASEKGLQVLLELYDPSGMRRLQLVRYRGGLSPRARIGPDGATTTLNARCGEITAGQWQYRIAVRNVSSLERSEASALDWRLEVLPGGPAVRSPDEEMYPCQDTLEQVPPPRGGAKRLSLPHAGLHWLGGDLHQHSTLSDGTLSPNALVRQNMALGHGFMAITDHQVYQPGRVLGSFQLVGGSEVTTPSGHFLALGDDLHTGFLGQDSDAVYGDCVGLSALVERLHGEGLLLVLCHPRFPPWHWRCEKPGDLPFQAMEIICDPAHGRAGQATEAALELWDTLLASGSRIVGVGGSDFHSGPQTPLEGYTALCNPGDPLTFLGTSTPQPQAGELLQALRSGRVSVGRGVFPGFSLLFNGHEYGPGDTVLLDSGTGLEVLRLRSLLRSVSPSKMGQVFWCSVVSSEGRIGPFKVDADGMAVETLFKPAGPSGWLRLEVRDKDGALQGFANPVRWQEGFGAQG